MYMKKNYLEGSKYFSLNCNNRHNNHYRELQPPAQEILSQLLSHYIYLVESQESNSGLNYGKQTREEKELSY